MVSKNINKMLMLIVLLIVFEPCYPISNLIFRDSKKLIDDSKAILSDSLPIDIIVDRNITVEDYFQYIDSIVETYNKITPYKLTEHLLVRTNPWIIDTLQNTDYYRMLEQNTFVYDQKQLKVLPKGNLIRIPSKEVAEQLFKSFQNTILDVNIPEFKLRIYEGTSLRYELPVRVGRNEKKYLEMSGRIQDLRTKTGNGYIVNHIRNPRYFNPVNNHEYFVTKRDDERITKLPQIPFIETEINGIKYGQLIHPTTNPATLGKASSNGCIGTKESDAWLIYYYAPIGTKIKIRYDLNSNVKGEINTLNDIYGYSKEEKD